MSKISKAIEEAKEKLVLDFPDLHCWGGDEVNGDLMECEGALTSAFVREAKKIAKVAIEEVRVKDLLLKYPYGDFRNGNIPEAESYDEYPDFIEAMAESVKKQLLEEIE